MALMVRPPNNLTRSMTTLSATSEWATPTASGNMKNTVCCASMEWAICRLSQPSSESTR